MTMHLTRDAAVDGMPALPGVPSRATSRSHNPLSTSKRVSDDLVRPETLGPLLESVALYLHIPFCTAKCPYCDFNSYAGMMGLREAYVAALIEEITLAGARARHADDTPRRARTINFGGGTPSLLTSEQVAAILAAVRAAFTLDANAEISLEANPGALEYGRLDELRAVGVNRLSMGAQSFDADLLRWLGRIHGPDDIEEAFAAARAAGFENINLDFMYALPGQSLDTWRATLDRALKLRPDHLSLYSLIIEEDTPLFRWVEQGRVQPADEDIAADMYEVAEGRLRAEGYAHYEISNWAQPGRECVHNLTYWQNLPYIGLGAGAHSWYAGHRFAEVRPLRAYIARVAAACERAGRPVPGEMASVSRGRALPTFSATRVSRVSPVIGDHLPPMALAEDEEIDRMLEMSETAILGLRLVRGLDLALFQERFGHSFDEAFRGNLDDVAEAGLVERVREPGEPEVEWLRLTPRGRLLGNEVFARLLPTGEDSKIGR